MDKEFLSPTKELNSIKLIRGQRGNYGWEVKLVGEDEKEIVGRLKDVDEELSKTHTELNKKEVNK